MKALHMIGRRAHPRLLAVAAWLVALAWLAAGCSSDVDVTFNLINPCQEDILFQQGCQRIKLVIYSLDPNDPLHPSHMAEGLGPRDKTCAMTDGNCSLSGSDLLGAGRVVDVLCYPNPEGAPVARASSSSLLFDDSDEGVGGKTMDLLVGNINGFVETTVTNPKNNVGTCSWLAQDQGRYGHAATLLEDGRVLISGGVRRYGQGVEEILATAEIFDPNTGEHRLVLGSDGMPATMASSGGRAYHTATRLRDGRVLLAGGVSPIQQGASTVKSALRAAEIFDPATESFGSPMDMGTGRAHHAATMLSTGRVLLTGGASYANGQINSYYNSGVLFDPDTNVWTPVGNTMATPRAFHQAVLLDASTQGKVLVIGGENDGGTLNSVDIFNPEANQFYNGVNVTMAKNRSHFCATRLESGEVLVSGGTTTKDDPATTDVHEWTPDTGVEIYSTTLGGSFGGFKTDTINLAVARMDHTCTTLDTGNVMVAGGLTGGGLATGVGEQVRIGTGTYVVEQLSDSLNPQRFLHTATLLRNGWVLLAGGLPNGDAQAAAVVQSMLFVPPPAYQ